MSLSTEEKACYSVNIDERGQVQADWEHNNLPGWSVSEKVGCRWEGGNLTQEGYEAILTHFRLTEMSAELPMEKVQGMSPSDLHARRAEYEKGHKVNEPNWDPRSQRRGFESVPASQVV